MVPRLVSGSRDTSMRLTLLVYDELMMFIETAGRIADVVFQLIRLCFQTVDGAPLQVPPVWQRAWTSRQSAPPLNSLAGSRLSRCLGAGC